MLRLELGGVPHAVLPDGSMVKLAAREAALLAWLWIEGPTPRARLAGLLWPGGSETQARANLRQTLARLRRGVGEVCRDDGGVLELAAQVRAAAGEGPLLAALEFDDADALARWLDAQRQAQAARRLAEAVARVRHQLEEGALDEALLTVEAALAADPEREELHRLRMETCYLRGDRAAAIAAWDHCKDVLRRAFGVLPSAETQALGRTILSAEPPPRAEPGRLPAELRHPPRLIGREAAWRAMVQAQAEGRVVCVSGAAGSGKSRLLAAWRQEQRRSLTVELRAGDAEVPDAAIGRLVEQALDEGRVDPAAVELGAWLPLRRAAPPLSSAIERRQALRAIGRLLDTMAGDGTLAVVVDDLQHADLSSLEAWPTLLETSAKVQWAFGLRRGDSPAQRVVQLLVEQGRAAEVGLEPWRADDVLALVRALPLPDPAVAAPLAEAVHQQVGGLPAQVLESLKGWWWAGHGSFAPGEPLPLPPTLRESLRRRLDGLSAEALQMAQLAAVARRSFSLALAAAVFERPVMSVLPLLAELSRAEVFAGQGFASPVLADDLLDSLEPPLRRELHRLVAERLATLGGEPAAIAQHWLLAGDAVAAIPWQLRAADAAQRRWQLAEAAALYEAAASALDPRAERERTLLAWREAARHHNTLGQIDAAQRALDAATPLVRTAREASLVDSTRMMVAFNREQFGEAAPLAVRMAAELPQVHERLDDTELAQLVMSVVLVTPYLAEGEAILRLCRTLRARAGRSALLDVRLDLGEALVLNWLGRPLEAVPLLLRADDGAARHGLLGERVNIGNQRLRTRELLGDLPGAMAAAEATLLAITDAGVGAPFEGDLQTYVALMACAMGDAARGREALERARQLRGGAAARGGYQALREALCRFSLGEVAVARTLWQSVTAPPAPAPLGAFRAWVGALVSGAENARTAALEQARPFIPGPGLLALRQQVLQALEGPIDPAALAALLDDLDARGLRSLAFTLRRRPGLPVERAAPPDPWIDMPRLGEAARPR